MTEQPTTATRKIWLTALIVLVAISVFAIRCGNSSDVQTTSDTTASSTPTGNGVNEIEPPTDRCLNGSTTLCPDPRDTPMTTNLGTPTTNMFWRTTTPIAVTICFLAASCGSSATNTAANNNTASNTAASNSAANNTAVSNTSTNSGAEQIEPTTSGPIDITKIPIGDGKVSSEAKAGNTFACNTNFREGGARHIGDWYDEAAGTWNYLEKVRVSGDVPWPNASSSISIVGTQRILETNSLPKDHNSGVFPIRRNDPAYEFDTNPNPIGAQDLTYTLPLNPKLAAEATCVPLGPIGVMTDGVVLFNALDDAGLDAVAHETQDRCDGHPSGREIYHYHNVANCTLETALGASTLVGYALDGFGIYVERDSDGNLLTNADLDECHGRTSSITWDGQQTNMYHYVATLEYPYTVGCLRGTPVVGPGTR